MTCIAGLVHEGKVCIGGDSAGIEGYHLVPRADSKVFRNGPYLIGFTSSFRMGQILRYEAVLPPPPSEGAELMRHMVVDFIGAVRKVFDAGGYAKRDNQREEAGAFLVGVNGRLFEVNSDYQVGESLADFAAVGCGATYAMGAMNVTRGLPKRRVLRALKTAERFSAGVRGPFVVMCASD